MTAAEIHVSFRQRGSAMILSIMVMMGLGLIALNSLQQQLSAGLALTSNQHRYVIAWENAASALAWGLRQSWKESSEPLWQCYGRWHHRFRHRQSVYPAFIAPGYFSASW